MVISLCYEIALETNWMGSEYDFDNAKTANWPYLFNVTIFAKQALYNLDPNSCQAYYLACVRVDKPIVLG
jgi:hypothetical protein